MALGNETRKGDGGWFPSIIFEKVDSGPRNAASKDQVEPTPSYDAQKFPLFRKNPAGNDEEAD